MVAVEAVKLLIDRLCHFHPATHTGRLWFAQYSGVAIPTRESGECRRLVNLAEFHDALLPVGQPRCLHHGVILLAHHIHVTPHTCRQLGELALDLVFCLYCDAFNGHCFATTLRGLHAFHVHFQRLVKRYDVFPCQFLGRLLLVVGTTVSICVGHTGRHWLRFIFRRDYQSFYPATELLFTVYLIVLRTIIS